MNLHGMKRIHFDTTDRNRWLKIISEAESTYRNCTDEQIFFNFDGINAIDKITPIHIVSLACLIESLVGRAAHVYIENRTNPVSRYLGEMLRFQEYWAGRQNFVQAQDSTIFNLWRIKDEEKELHSRRIYDYLKQNFFRHKDLSAVQNSLDEAYYNIFDHAQAANNAFSFIQFDEQTEKLMWQFAISVWGLPDRFVLHSLPYPTMHLHWLRRWSIDLQPELRFTTWGWDLETSKIPVRTTIY